MQEYTSTSVDFYFWIVFSFNLHKVKYEKSFTRIDFKVKISFESFLKDH